MSLKVTIEGQGSFEVAKECVKKVVYKTDIPLDSNARTKDVGSTLEISGKILTATDGDPFDSTRQMGLWCMLPEGDGGDHPGRHCGAEVLLPQRFRGQLR